MKNDLQIAVVGLDTSHAVEFPRRTQAPDCEDARRVEGLRVTACLRFSTPFTDASVLAERTAELEKWDIVVTDDFDRAVSGAEAILISINDPAKHLEYFERCAGLGKPIFLDKPLADTLEAASKIAEIAKSAGTRFFSSSSLRFAPELVRAAETVQKPDLVTVYGPLNAAPAGSSVLWYGVHAFEMLQELIGTGATEITLRRDSRGAVAIVQYGDRRRGIVELTGGNSQYGGTARNENRSAPFVVNMPVYAALLRQIRDFFRGGSAPVPVNNSLEIMKLLGAAEESYDSGMTVSIV